MLVGDKSELVDYNDPLRCVLLCTAHHLLYHRITPLNKLDLNRAANDWAIDKLEARLEDYKENN